jgi:large subunit ribosomal protein L24
MTRQNASLFHSSTNLAGRTISSTLSDNLREQYRRRSCRVVKGDNVRVLRGEYSGIEGKVEKVNTARGSLSIEGIQREKIKGGNVKVQIHSSNVIITGLNFDDKRRQKSLEKISNQAKPQQSKRKNRKIRAKKRPNKKEANA